MSCVDHSLKDDVLIDLLGEVEKYFDLKKLKDPYRVKLMVVKLRGHATLKWDDVKK